MSDLRLPVPGSSLAASGDCESFIDYTMLSGPGATTRYLIYYRSIPLRHWNDFPEEDSILSFDVNEKGNLISKTRCGNFLTLPASTIESGIKFARRYFNNDGDSSISLDLEHDHSQQADPTADMVQRFKEFLQKDRQIKKGEKFSLKRGQEAKEVHTAFFSSSDSALESRKTRTDSGTKRMLKHINGLSSRNHQNYKALLMQAIWEFKRDSCDSTQLAGQMKDLVDQAIEYIACDFNDSVAQVGGN